MTGSVRNSSRVVLGAFIAVGIVVAVLGATVIRSATTVPPGWVTVEGTVVDVETWNGADGVTYTPIVGYAVDGTTYGVASSVGSSSRPQVGEVIEVAYDPASPADAKVTGGIAGFAWLIAVGFGIAFSLAAALILAGGRRGSAGGQPMPGRGTVADGTGRTRYTRNRAGRLVGLVVPWIGAPVMAALAVVVLSSGGLGLPAALLPAFFAVLLLAAGVAELRRGMDPRVAEVGADGIWLPGLGDRRWDEIAEIRLEAWTGPAGGNRPHDHALRVATYRRLGFVPVDPSLAQGRGVAERLAAAMSGGFNRTLARAVGRDPIELAPFGVMEAELGPVTFDALVAQVRGLRPVVERAEQESAVASPLERFVRREG